MISGRVRAEERVGHECRAKPHEVARGEKPGRVSTPRICSPALPRLAVLGWLPSRDGPPRGGFRPTMNKG